MYKRNNFQLQEQEKVCWTDNGVVMWLMKHCRNVYYKNFQKDSAVRTAAVMRRRNQPHLSQSPSLFFPAAYHTSHKTGRILKSDLPLRTNNVPNLKSQRQKWAWSLHSIHIVTLLFWSWGWFFNSNSEDAASIHHCYYRKQQQEPKESTNSHPIITWPSHDFK